MCLDRIHLLRTRPRSYNAYLLLLQSSTSPSKFETGENDWGIANVVIITGLSTANERIQIQALEVSRMLYSKRLYTDSF